MADDNGGRESGKEKNHIANQKPERGYGTTFHSEGMIPTNKDLPLGLTSKDPTSNITILGTKPPTHETLGDTFMV
jgi:hypothetical protein